MNLALESVAWVVVLGGWTYMWLVWSFDADVRSWIAARLFPEPWLGGRPRKDVAIMGPPSFDKWLVQSSSAPLAVCQLLMCKKCYSAHASGCGALLLVFSGSLPILVVPLVWAAGAALGNLIYDNAKRPN
jgi:hypothetical protein